MDKRQMLDILMLLSALESWAFAQGKMIPDYLHENLGVAVQCLSNELLGEKDKQ